MPKSKLSRRIALLEERLGTRLIQRSTRHFSMTEVGRSFYEHCNAMLMEAEAAQEVVDATRMATAREQVAIEVEVLELAKSAALNFGLTFGGGQVTGVTNGIRQYVFAPGQLMAGEAAAGNPASFGTIDFLATRIDALQTRGEAKLLARPTLVTSSGGTASFLAGGEIPIPVPQGLGQTTITWKEFGVRLEVTPTVADGGKIDLAVKPEVSSLDFSNGVKQDNITIPAIRTRRADTRVNLGAGQTLMLGGLLDSESDHALTLLPGLGDLPVIGELLRSRAFQVKSSSTCSTSNSLTSATLNIAAPRARTSSGSSFWRIAAASSSPASIISTAARSVPEKLRTAFIAHPP